jgi:hypothetical protein
MDIAIPKLPKHRNTSAEPIEKIIFETKKTTFNG